MAKKITDGLLVQVLVLSVQLHLPQMTLLPFWTIFACSSWLLDVPYYTGESCLASSHVWMEKCHAYTVCNSVEAQHLLGWIDLLGDGGSVWGVKREQDVHNYVVPRNSGMFRKHSTRLKKRGKSIGQNPGTAIPACCASVDLTKCNWTHGAIGLQTNWSHYTFTFPQAYYRRSWEYAW